VPALSGEPRVVPVDEFAQVEPYPGYEQPCRRDRIPSSGLTDIKTHYTETPDDIIERAYLPGPPRSGTPGNLH
jgi:hypothetical protein